MGQFGLENILDISNGPIGDGMNGGFILQDSVETSLNVVIYDTLGNITNIFSDCWRRTR